MSATVPVDLGYPFLGKWLVQNSPANHAPRHGTASFASSYTIIFSATSGRAPSRFVSVHACSSAIFSLNAEIPATVRNHISIYRQSIPFPSNGPARYR